MEEVTRCSAVGIWKVVERSVCVVEDRWWTGPPLVNPHCFEVAPPVLRHSAVEANRKGLSPHSIATLSLQKHCVQLNQVPQLQSPPTRTLSRRTLHLENDQVVIHLLQSTPSARLCVGHEWDHGCLALCVQCGQQHPFRQVLGKWLFLVIQPHSGQLAGEFPRESVGGRQAGLVVK